MCGIVGAICKNGTDWFSAALRSLSHRGPNDEGIWRGEAGIILGQRRLSIIDLSAGGHQPKFSQQQQFVVVYNGELYNFQQLRQQLEQYGIAFHSQSDTEVLLAAYEHWGIEEALQKFAGMFAIGLWEQKKQRLVLTRDRLGIKPLYYGTVGQDFVFASELKPFLHHPQFQKKLDANAISLYLRYGYIPAPYSIYEGVYKVLPGEIVTIEPQAYSLQRQFYWQAKTSIEKSKNSPYIKDIASAVNELEMLLTECITQHMIADVPLGAFLSGGIDSATVVAIMQKNSQQKVKTFTIGFDEVSYNEAPYAKKVAEHLGTEHYECYIKNSQVSEIIPKLPVIYDEPFADSSQIPTFLVSRLARQHVTVALSGDGGDEVFAGYNRYFIGGKLWGWAQTFPLSLRQNIATGLKKISCNYYSKFLSPRMVTKIPKIASVLLAQNDREMYQSLVCTHPQAQQALLLSASVFEQIYPQFSSENFVEQMMFYDTVSYLPNDILTKVDRASMANSLEARVPFLDHRILEFAWTLPMDWKINKRYNKWILRKILHRYLPRELQQTKKRGFALPLHLWLRTFLRPWVEDMLAELQRDGIFSAKIVQQIWQQHLSGQYNHQDFLWTLLMFQTWKQKIE